MKLRWKPHVCSWNSVRFVAPIDGRTGELLVSEGNLIKANADDHMVTINQITPIKVSFTVPGNNLPEIKKYLAAGSLQVLIPGIKGEPLKGTFAFLDNRVDTTPVLSC